MNIAELIGLIIAVLAFFLLALPKPRVAEPVEEALQPIPEEKRKKKREQIPVVPMPQAVEIKPKKKTPYKKESLKKFIVMKEVLGKPKGL